MHTVFINTSPSVSSRIYQELLFEKLMEEHKLIIPQDHVPLDQLEDCAAGLAHLIDSETAIREDIRLLVYFESSVQQSMSPVSDSARSVALQELQCIKAEYALVKTLHDMGKVPGEVLFVFGEKIRRNVEENDRTYQEVLQETYWNNIALPDCEETAAFLNRSPQIALEEIIAHLSSCGEKEALINRKDRCYAGLVDKLARNIASRHKNGLPWTGREVMEKSEWAAGAYRGRRKSELIGEGFFSRVQFAHLPLEYRDVKERSRSLCRLMLCVYAASCKEEGTFRANLFGSSDAEIPGADGSTLERAFCLPQVNCASLMQAVQEQLYYCEHPDYTGADAPAELSECLSQEDEKGGQLIKSQYPLPQLLADASVGFGMTVKGLEKAVDTALSDIRRKNKENNDEIRKYLNRITSEYDRIKDQALNNVPVTREDLAAVQHAVTGEDSMDSARIDNLKNVEEQMDRLQRQAELGMLDAAGRITTPRDVEKAVENVQRQTNEYFISLRRSLLKAIAFTVFVVLFLAPYAAIQFDLFQAKDGIWYFLGVTAAAALAVALGWAVFSACCKRRIVRLVRRLCREFNQTQQANQCCLQEYANLLYNKVPRCYGLSRYEEMLRSYRQEMQLRKEKITCHDVTLSRRARLIRTWMEGMDLEEALPLSTPQAVPLLDPNRGRTENEAYYVLDIEQVLSALMKETEGEA